MKPIGASDGDQRPPVPAAIDAMAGATMQAATRAAVQVAVAGLRRRRRGPSFVDQEQQAGRRTGRCSASAWANENERRGRRTGPSSDRRPRRRTSGGRATRRARRRSAGTRSTAAANVSPAGAIASSQRNGERIEREERCPRLELEVRDVRRDRAGIPVADDLQVPVRVPLGEHPGRAPRAARRGSRSRSASTDCWLARTPAPISMHIDTTRADRPTNRERRQIRRSTSAALGWPGRASVETSALGSSGQEPGRVVVEVLVTACCRRTVPGQARSADMARHCGQRISRMPWTLGTAVAPVRASPAVHRQDASSWAERRRMVAGQREEPDHPARWPQNGSSSSSIRASSARASPARFQRRCWAGGSRQPARRRRRHRAQHRADRPDADAPDQPQLDRELRRWQPHPVPQAIGDPPDLGDGRPAWPRCRADGTTRQGGQQAAPVRAAAAGQGMARVPARRADGTATSTGGRPHRT